MKRRASTRWFRLWIATGAGLAVLLLASSVVNYVVSARGAALRSTRREMARQMADLDKLARVQRLDAPSLSIVLDRMVDASSGRLLWAQVLDRDGEVIARSGAAAAPAFTVDYVASRIRERLPIFTVRETHAGKVVVEAFPIRLPQPSSAGPIKLVAFDRTTPNMAFVELASLANAGPWTVGPSAWTLILGITGGLSLLGALVALMVRFREHLSARRVERQIEIARQVQRGLLPAATDSPRNFKIAAEWRPAANVSGDFYDAFDLPEGAAFVLGDVSGKDVPAAMLAGVIQGTVHAADWTRSAGGHNAATEQLNRLLCQRASDERFASLFWGYFDARTGLLHYVNCGHCAPLLFRGKRTVKLYDGGPVLGLLPRARFEQGVERLEEGDLLILYSDGVIEAANARGEEFGEHGLIAAVESAELGSIDVRADPAAVRDRVLRAVRAFTGSSVLADDQTLLAIRYTGSTVAALEAQAA